MFEALTRDTLAQALIVDNQFTLIPKKGEVSGQALPAMVMCLKHDRTHSTAAPIAIENLPITITLKSEGINLYGGSPMQEGYSNLMSRLQEEYLDLNQLSWTFGLPGADRV